MPSPETTQLQADMTALEGRVDETVTDLDSLAAKIDALIAAGNGATAAELTDLSTRVHAMQTKLSDADARDTRA